MNNYYYIVAGLPELSKDAMRTDMDAGALTEEIKSQCSRADAAVISLLEKSWTADNLTENFYREVLACGNDFLKKWFKFDLDVRNAKVAYLNEALGREKDRDIIRTGEDETGETFEEASKVASVLATDDIIARERGIDDLYWEKADELTLFHYFDLTVILGFIVKMKIVDRWLRLDEQTGREMFRKLVDEVRSTFRGVERDVPERGSRERSSVS